MQNDQLRLMFRESRQSQPDLTEVNFTKLVLNRLPATPVRARQRQWLPDLLGMLVAILAIWVLVEPAKLIDTVMANLPTSIVISSSNMLMVAVILVMTALVGWWIVEQDA